EARRFTFAREGLEEHRAWMETLAGAPAAAALPANAKGILQYAFSELVNNAVEHSGGTRVDVLFEFRPESVSFEVSDDGEGIFEHVRVRLRLESDLEALQELSKGKITTSPENHTGEGLFFVSKIADLFEVDSGGLRWVVDGVRGDTAVAQSAARKGTLVRFALNPGKETTLEALFEAYTSDFAFVKTRAVVKLFAFGVRFVSRSEAKRLLRGLEKFREVEVDFTGVEEGFADEVFRVWARAHPEVRLEPTGMNRAVAFMVERARRAAAAPEP
ncbi:MAG: ATP-binding protein, partial [Planctomycetes bacterium]|nr:ATP-binding protein [Planctomycetota bacterium]